MPLCDGSLLGDLADVNRKSSRGFTVIADAESRLEQWQDLSFDLLGLTIRTSTVSDLNAAKEILGKPVPLLCACFGAETLSSEMATALAERTYSHVKSMRH